MICVSWEGNFQNFFKEFPFLDSGQVSGCCRLILNLSTPKTNTNDVLINYENDLKKTLEMTVKQSQETGDIGIDIFGMGIPAKDFIVTPYSRFGKISVGVDGFFSGIHEIKNEILKSGKILFSETISELILHLIVKKKKLLDGIKSVPDYLGGKYNFVVLGGWGVFVYCSAGMIVASRRDGGAMIGTNFLQIPDFDFLDVVKQNGILYLQNGYFRAVP